MTPEQLTTWNKTRANLKSFVYHRTGDRALAEDLVQDVFLKVHDHFDQLKEPGKITGWIFRIARNVIADHFRKNARQLQREDIDWAVNPRPLNDCVSTCLEEKMNGLPDKYRQALELAELKNIPQVELAKALNVSYSGVKSRIQRARQMLKERMTESYVIELDRYGNVVVCEDKATACC